MMRVCNFAKYMLKENTNEYKLYMYYEQLSKGNGIYNYCIIGNDKVVKKQIDTIMKNWPPEYCTSFIKQYADDPNADVVYYGNHLSNCE